MIRAAWVLMGGWFLLTGFSCGPTLKNCSLSKDCKSTERCVDYRCQALDSCSSDADCQAPRRCVQSRCTEPPKGCATDKDCAAGRVCKEKLCVDPPPKGCATDKDCASPRICKDKRCVDPPQGCKVDGDCPKGQSCQNQECKLKPCSADGECPSGQQCKSGQCVPPAAVGTCRLKASPSSVYFEGQNIGESKTKSLEITNLGDGNCQLDKVALEPKSGLPGTVTFAPVAAQQIKPKGKLKIELSFKALSKGSVKAGLEFFRGNTVIHSVPLYLYVTGNTAIPTKGWGVVSSGQMRSFARYVGGCFWDDNTFELVSARPFQDYSRGGVLNPRQGVLLLTKNGGVDWECVGCVAGGGVFPRNSSHEMVDFFYKSMTCGKDRAYILGRVDAGGTLPQGKTTLFSRTSTGSWKGVQSGELAGEVTYNEQLLAYDNRWFHITGLVSKVEPQADGSLKQSGATYLPPFQGSVFHRVKDLHIAHNTGLIVGTIDTPRTRTETPLIRYNTQNGEVKVPQGNTKPIEQLMKEQWPATASTPSCGNDCVLRKGLVLSSTRFLVMGIVTDASSRKTNLVLWWTDDRGKSWKEVYRTTEAHIIHGDMLQVSGTRVLVALGGDPNNPPQKEDQKGVLLESNDGGQSFVQVKASSFAGKTLTQGLLDLYAIRMSPDKKTIYVLGRDLILRWKP